MAAQLSKTVIFLATVLFCCIPCTPGLLHADQAVSAKNFIHQGGYALVSDGHISMAENSTTPFIPASTLKIITSLAALEILGPDYHFATRISRDQYNNLYIQGSGDPFLLTENIISIVQRLQETGVEQINNLIMDESAYQLDFPADGCENSTNPYDAWNSALAVNFNSIAIRVAPDRTVSSADPKVPFLPMMQTIGATLPPGHHHLNVNAFKATGKLSNTLRYSGELFAALLAQKQIIVRGAITAGQTPTTATPLLSYRSDKTVQEMIKQCLKYSNNFVANQLFLACGSARLGAPATWDKARTALRSYISENLGISESELVMFEGSGLSRRNRMTPRAMITALQKFAPYQELLPIKKGFPLKSGTLKGVYCYAGYIPQQQDAPFVILLNQVQNNRDEVLHILSARQNTKTALTAKSTL
ncbi:MAG: D-alanyl-D-alanine carboxypeptidase [Proteobacteria bacterium]|nr:D-alanyl-D-alanine carboxypeptidase [Pseudomonadota bacterium]MBU1649948.1 D-alanyl-D-alanine carboxypeptidase [Pseudomonadota bacterium]